MAFNGIMPQSMGPHLEVTNPWAACVQDGDGYYFTLEQQELVQALRQQSADNPDQIELEGAIATMASLDEIRIEA